MAELQGGAGWKMREMFVETQGMGVDNAKKKEREKGKKDKQETKSLRIPFLWWKNMMHEVSTI